MDQQFFSAILGILVALFPMANPMKLSELGTRLKGGSPDLIDWLLSPTSAQRTLYELPGLLLSSYYPQ